MLLGGVEGNSGYGRKCAILLSTLRTSNKLMLLAGIDLLTFVVEAITEVIAKCPILKVSVLVFRFSWRCRATPHALSPLCLRA
jgi:hypothetical protein